MHGFMEVDTTSDVRGSQVPPDMEGFMEVELEGSKPYHLDDPELAEYNEAKCHGLSRRLVRWYARTLVWCPRVILAVCTLLAIGLGAVAAHGFKIESYNKFLHFSQVGAHSLGAQTSAVTLSELDQLKAFSQQVW